MANLLNYLWIIILAIYIISPFDAHPLFLDDLIAAGVLFYMMYKNAKRKKQNQQYYSHSNNQSHNKTAARESNGSLTLDDAYRLLGVSPSNSLEEISRAYKDKMSRSHPDKVSHLSEELQEKAKELTLTINEALELIKRHKGRS
jgi:DnaJ like chaperone protein